MNNGEGIKVRIFDLDKGLREYEHIQYVRIVCPEYNLLVMEDYLPIIGEIDGNIDIHGDGIDMSFKDIKAFYMHSKNVFNLMIKER